MQKTLVIIGVVILIVGLGWPWFGKIPLGRLPGDIIISKPGFTFYFPITTMIVISILISVIIKLFK